MTHFLPLHTYSYYNIHFCALLANSRFNITISRIHLPQYILSLIHFLISFYTTRVSPALSDFHGQCEHFLGGLLLLFLLQLMASVFRSLQY